MIKCVILTLSVYETKQAQTCDVENIIVNVICHVSIQISKDMPFNSFNELRVQWRMTFFGENIKVIFSLSSSSIMPENVTVSATWLLQLLNKD